MIVMLVGMMPMMGADWNGSPVAWRPDVAGRLVAVRCRSLAGPMLPPTLGPSWGPLRALLEGPEGAPRGPQESPAEGPKNGGRFLSLGPPLETKTGGSLLALLWGS